MLFRSVPFDGKYKEIFNSDNVKYGGTGMVNSRVKRSRAMEWDDRPYCVTVKTAPLSLSIFQYIPLTEEEIAREALERAAAEKAEADRLAAKKEEEYRKAAKKAEAYRKDTEKAASKKTGKKAESAKKTETGKKAVSSKKAAGGRKTAASRKAPAKKPDAKPEEKES